MDSITKSKLKRLISNSDWEVIYTFQSFLVENWNKAELKDDTEFKTMWNLAFLKGKIEGVKELLDQAERVALDN